jgi:hypothetical protein
MGEGPENEVYSNFKNYHFWDTADLLQYFVPSQLLELIYPPKSRPKIPALGTVFVK